MTIMKDGIGALHMASVKMAGTATPCKSEGETRSPERHIRIPAGKADGIGKNRHRAGSFDFQQWRVYRKDYGQAQQDCDEAGKLMNH